MDDERLTRLLRELPRDDASPHFTAVVLRRLDHHGPRPAFRGPTFRRLALAAGAAAVFAVALFGVHEATRGAERRRELARLEALEAEKRALEDEIRELSRLARDARPVIYLDSTPAVDLVVDLGRLAARRREQQFRPASYTTAERPQGEPHR